jgi:hypothetical protein
MRWGVAGAVLNVAMEAAEAGEVIKPVLRMP